MIASLHEAGKSPRWPATSNQAAHNAQNSGWIGETCSKHTQPGRATVWGCLSASRRASIGSLLPPRPTAAPRATNHIAQWLQELCLLCSSQRLGGSNPNVMTGSRQRLSAQPCTASLRCLPARGRSLVAHPPPQDTVLTFLTNPPPLR